MVKHWLIDMDVTTAEELLVHLGLIAIRIMICCGIVRSLY